MLSVFIFIPGTDVVSFYFHTYRGYLRTDTEHYLTVENCMRYDWNSVFKPVVMLAYFFKCRPIKMFFQERRLLKMFN